MTEFENGHVNSMATSGPGWKRLDDGTYLWRRYQWSEANILSEAAFKAVNKVLLMERSFAILTLAPVAPMVVLLLKERLSLSTFAAILACLTVPNIMVNLYAGRRVRDLTRHAKPSLQPSPAFPTNPLSTISDRHLRGAIILLSVWGVAILFALMQLIPGMGLPPPPKQFNVYAVVCILAIVGAVLFAVIRERKRRKHQG